MDYDIRDLPYPIHVVSVRPLDGYRLALDFEIGYEKEPMAGEFDMSDYLNWPCFAPLREPGRFAEALTNGETVVWPGDMDVAPERLYTDCVVTSGSRHFRDGRPL